MARSRNRFSRGVAVGRRRGLSDRELLVSEGFFSGAATSAHQAFFVPLLVYLGIGSGALGLYSALNGLLANVSGLAGSRAARRLPDPRALAAIASGAGRGMFLIVAALLLLQGGSTSTTVLIALALLSAALIGLALPAVTTMVAEAVEQRERGAFFANRLMAAGVGAAVVTLGIAALLGALHPPNGFTAAYLFAGLAGVGSVACLLAIRDTPSITVPSAGPAAHASPLSPLIRRYAVTTFILWFGAAMVAPILTPFILTDLGASPSFIGLQGAVSALIAIGVQRWWGRRVDRDGAYNVLRVCIVAVATLPPLYAIAPTYWFGLGYEVIAAIGWSGYALANLNFAVQLAPEEERARYIAVNNAAAGVGSFLGPLTGAALAGVLPVEAVLFLAGAVRLTAFIALRFARPEPLPKAQRRLRRPRVHLTIRIRRRGAAAEQQTDEGMDDA